ncbi:hypothetical protein BH11BAC7_BH11BAC7_14530 [soil metagenome]
MQEIFFTVLIIWVIWKLFGAFSQSSAPRGQQNTTHHHHYHTPPKKEGEVRIEKKVSPESRIPPTEGEYVDYEEIK